jgi:hypothetical protein
VTRHHVVIVAHEGVEIFDVAGPASVFGGASVRLAALEPAGQPSREVAAGGSEGSEAAEVGGPMACSYLEWYVPSRTPVSLCPTCSGTDVVLVESRGHLEVFRCRSCGAETAGTAYYLEHDLFPEAYLLVGVRLRARWRGEVPSWRELAALRHVFPALTHEPIGEFAARLRGGEPFVSEPVTPTEADRLIAEARARALVLEPTGEPPCTARAGR